jgi:hypothetical protein
VAEGAWTAHILLLHHVRYDGIAIAMLQATCYQARLPPPPVRQLPHASAFQRHHYRTAEALAYLSRWILRIRSKQHALEASGNHSSQVHCSHHLAMFLEDCVMLSGLTTRLSKQHATPIKALPPARPLAHRIRQSIRIAAAMLTFRQD